MYLLFSRVPESLVFIQKKLSDHIIMYGNDILTNSNRNDNNRTCKKKNDIISNIVQALVQFYAETSNIVSSCFCNDSNMKKILKDGFEEFMNAKEYTPFYIATFIDEAIKNRIKKRSLRNVSNNSISKETIDIYDHDNVETWLKNVIILFRFLRDKDIFEEFYKDFLAKRLLNRNLKSHDDVDEDIEKEVISNLKTECGFQFTCKLEGMIKDIKVAQSFIYDYLRCNKKKSINNIPDDKGISKSTSEMELNVIVLTSGYWPLFKPKNRLNTNQFPEMLSNSIKKFEKFYFKRYSGRKLEWYTNHGSAEIKYSVDNNDKNNTYELHVTTYQMFILLLFNDKETIFFNEILSSLKINEKELRRHLISLCTPRYKILLKNTKGKIIDSESTSFCLNKNYHSNFYRVKVPLVSSKENTMDHDDSNKLEDEISNINNKTKNYITKSVLEERKHVTEATIVRIMKSRRTIEHNILISEVISVLSSRFIASPLLIKLRIEALIEREYIERSKNDHKVYKYIA